MSTDKFVFDYTYFKKMVGAARLELARTRQWIFIPLQFSLPILDQIVRGLDFVFTIDV